MKETKGKADPKVVNELLRAKLQGASTAPPFSNLLGRVALPPPFGSLATRRSKNEHVGLDRDCRRGCDHHCRGAVERVAHASDALVAGSLWPEYDRELEKAGGRREAERELAEREKRHDELELRPLSDDARERYIEEWQATQARFVDDPTGAVSEADDLVQRVMRESWLSGRRLRAAGGRHLRRAPGARGAVPHRERHRPR